MDESIELFKALINFEEHITTSMQSCLCIPDMTKFIRVCLGFFERGHDYPHDGTPFVPPQDDALYNRLILQNTRLEHILVQYHNKTIFSPNIRPYVVHFVCQMLRKQQPHIGYWDYINLKHQLRFQHCKGLSIHHYYHEGQRLFLIDSPDCPWKISFQNPLTAAYILRRSGELNIMPGKFSAYNVARILLEMLVPFMILAPYDPLKHTAKEQNWNDDKWKFADGRPLGLGRRHHQYRFQPQDWCIADEIAYKLLKQPHGVAAYQYGGPVARIAAASINIDNVLHGPTSHSTGRRQIHNTVYVYDELSGQEVNAIIGMYRLLSGKQFIISE